MASACTDRRFKSASARRLRSEARNVQKSPDSGGCARLRWRSGCPIRDDAICADQRCKHLYYGQRGWRHYRTYPQSEAEKSGCVDGDAVGRQHAVCIANLLGRVCDAGPNRVPRWQRLGRGDGDGDAGDIEIAEKHAAIGASEHDIASGFETGNGIDQEIAQRKTQRRVKVGRNRRIGEGFEEQAFEIAWRVGNIEEKEIGRTQIGREAAGRSRIIGVAIDGEKFQRRSGDLILRLLVANDDGGSSRRVIENRRRIGLADDAVAPGVDAPERRIVDLRLRLNADAGEIDADMGRIGCGRRSEETGGGRRF